MLRCSLLVCGLSLWSFTVAAKEELTIVSWGGAYEAAQSEALFMPFAKKQGISVKVARYAGETSALEDRAASEAWDVIDLLEDQAITACAAGQLLELDHIALGLDEGDFGPAPLRECSVPQNAFAMVFAYHDQVFRGAKPAKIEDFFDIVRFPGKRAIARTPDTILEWALMAEGVPPSQIYDLLSTDRGLRLAFRKLDQIRDHIVWWEGPGHSAALLRDGNVAMASGYNGRFFALAEDEHVPVSIVWDARLIGHAVWAIPASTQNSDAASKFLAFAVAPEQMARLAERIPYGPARISAFDFIGLNPDTGVKMRDHLPNASSHEGRALVRDSIWYSNTEELRQRRFEQWLKRP